jgi:hypothetical protein
VNEWKVADNLAMWTSDRPFRQQVDVEMTEDSLTVDAEQGSGYLREHITAHIPVRVIVKLLRNAGYVLTAPAPSSSPDPEKP